MHHLATLSGTGSLLTREAASAVATYRIAIYRHTSGPQQGVTVTQGVLATAPWAVVAARNDGSAILMLDTGEAVDVRFVDLGASDTTAIFILTGKLPAF
ncbi:hypothetical protein G3545_14190 [Starkeya sp. ORNL1]|uniref:hypothetical protein n=1 Tax=Starkeya sp. ORNL1 TaxID=2709380 RepID=UPI00146415C3|nr:hypothetical protein [Starkeya sp. ORNL1]QJP14693.1 hypothetical protein G3545_14190 [Starkeya sp. ORNL1]